MILRCCNIRISSRVNGWESCSGKTSLSINPADKQEVIGEFPDSNEEDVQSAIDAAKNAYESWRLVPAPKRAEILYRAGEMLRMQKQELAKDMTREMEGFKEAGGDVQEAIDMTYYIAGEGRRLHGHTTPSELPDKFMMSMRIPLGIPPPSLRRGIFRWQSHRKLFPLS